MTDDEKPARIVDAQGRPAPPAIPRCPRCLIESRPGDERKRVRSGGFGSPHDVCIACGYEWEELTV